MNQRRRRQHANNAAAMTSIFDCFKKPDALRRFPMNAELESDEEQGDTIIKGGKKRDKIPTKRLVKCVTPTRSARSCFFCSFVHCDQNHQNRCNHSS